MVVAIHLVINLLRPILSGEGQCLFRECSSHCVILSRRLPGTPLYLLRATLQRPH
jgi:hypothetical protein